MHIIELIKSQSQPDSLFWLHVGHTPPAVQSFHQMLEQNLYKEWELLLFQNFFSDDDEWRNLNFHNCGMWNSHSLLSYRWNHDNFVLDDAS